jgi:hypothetical protein
MFLFPFPRAVIIAISSREDHTLIAVVKEAPGGGGGGFQLKKQNSH